MTDISGTCDDRFSALQDAFAAELAGPNELGASVAVTVDGEFAVDMYDWPKSTGMLAAQAPWWEPGTASGYHALNQGHLVGEVVRRITGRLPGTFFAQEIAGPLKADFFIG